MLTLSFYGNSGKSLVRQRNVVACAPSFFRVCFTHNASVVQGNWQVQHGAAALLTLSLQYILINCDVTEQVNTQRIRKKI